MQTLQMLDTRTVSDMLNLSVGHVCRLVRLGDLEAVAKAPGSRGAYLFTAEEVEHYKEIRDLSRAGKKARHAKAAG